jgi:hypothetical protein
MIPVMSISTKWETTRLYFNRRDIVNSIKEMLSRADYKDITFNVEDVLHRGRTLKKAKHRIKLGNGWMGKDYKINWVYGIWGLKGVEITIRMSKYTRRTCIGQCTIGNLGHTISLDYPIMVTYEHARCTEESMEYYIRNEDDTDRSDLEDERDEANRIGMEMQIEHETEEVLWDQVD